MILIKNIGLAAYLKMGGCNVIGYVDGKFKFDSEESEIHWKVLYSNSVCLRRDQAVQDLLSYYGKKSQYDGPHSFWSKGLGFCAFALVKGVKLVGFEGSTKKFFFDHIGSYEELHVEYANSVCARHDNEVNRLREIAKL